VKTDKAGSTEGLTLSPGIILAESSEQAGEIQEMIRRFMKDNPKDGLIREIVGLSSLIPKNQEQKLAIIRSIHQLLKKKRDFVEGSERQSVDRLYERTSVQAISKETTPESLMRFFRERGRIPTDDIDPTEPHNVPRQFIQWLMSQDKVQAGTFLYVFPRKDMWDIRNATEYAEKISTFQIDNHALVMSSTHLIFADISAVVRSDGLKASSLALYVVFILVLLDFAFVIRSRRRFLLVLLAVPLPFMIYSLQAEAFSGGITQTQAFLLGMPLLFLVIFLIDRTSLGHASIVVLPLVLSFIGLLGAMPILGFRINFYNMLVLPTILGIGVDSSIHVYHRFLEQGHKSLPRIVRHTGAAISMATLTTSIGFGGMIFANHLGLQSLAKTALVGFGIMLFNAAIFLPCLIKVLHDQGWLPASTLQKEAASTQDTGP
jgi:predicted RND superfamily exporter protein